MWIFKNKINDAWNYSKEISSQGSCTLKSTYA